jgi:hypothetical protein
LQRELGQVRGEMARQSQDLGTLRQELASNESASEQRLNGLRATVEDGQRTVRRDVDTLANKLAVDRVDFEATKNRVAELAPGVSLRITNIDVPMHRVSGWMWVLPDRRTIWLRNEAVQQPIAFYSKEDGKKRELVITGVTKNGVTGYYLQPGRAVTAGGAAAGY